MNVNMVQKAFRIIMSLLLCIVGFLTTFKIENATNPMDFKDCGQFKVPPTMLIDLY